jgi:hypothetical protein
MGDWGRLSILGCSRHQVLGEKVECNRSVMTDYCEHEMQYVKSVTELVTWHYSEMSSTLACIVPSSSVKVS